MNAKIVSSLEKIFIDGESHFPEHVMGSALQGELYSFQIAYKNESGNRLRVKISIDSPLNDYITLYDVESVPSVFPAYPNNFDDDYLKTTAGLYPDVLKSMDNNTQVTAMHFWKSIWVSLRLPDEISAGIYPIKISLISMAGDESQNWNGKFNLEVIGSKLPEQRLLYTQWFHCDCLATYYNVEVFSEEHWVIIENYMKNAVEYGMNMILTPIFTPPLDTEKGGERLTVQLVKVQINEGQYIFDFSLLKRFIALAKSCGFKTFEISHLFTQWGAESAPKIMANVNGYYQQIFGWNTVATSKEYTNFLAKMLTELKSFLKEEGILDSCYFHISDEPNEHCLESYQMAQASIRDLLNECNVMDALSEYIFYKKGIVKTLIVANDKIDEFIDEGVEGLWTYYCCAQSKDVSNRFMSMPSYRNRIIAYQFYKYNIKGFLQWGYNFWNSHLSQFSINPYRCTDADGAFPSGDSFTVYPGEDRHPVSSLRQIVFHEALQDLRALELLENFMDKREIVKIMDEHFRMNINFKQYPKSAELLLNFRNTVNNLIKKYTVS